MKTLFLAIVPTIALPAASAWAQATDQSTQEATLSIDGECEVITAPIGVTSGNFVSADVTLQTTGDYTADFTQLPAALTCRC